MVFPDGGVHLRRIADLHKLAQWADARRDLHIGIPDVFL